MRPHASNSRLCPRLGARDDDPCRPQQPPVQDVALLDHREDLLGRRILRGLNEIASCRGVEGTPLGSIS